MNSDLIARKNHSSILDITLIAMLIGPLSAFADCDLPASDNSSADKLNVDLYVQGEVDIVPPAWIMSRGTYVSPEERIINECSKFLRAKTISDSLPERLNIFAHLPESARATAFIAVSSVDQKMAMEKTGPYWHSYVTAFPDLRFVGGYGSPCLRASHARRFNSVSPRSRQQACRPGLAPEFPTRPAGNRSDQGLGCLRPDNCKGISSIRVGRCAFQRGSRRGVHASRVA